MVSYTEWSDTSCKIPILFFCPKKICFLSLFAPWLCDRDVDPSLVVWCLMVNSSLAVRRLGIGCWWSFATARLSTNHLLPTLTAHQSQVSDAVAAYLRGLRASTILRPKIPSVWYPLSVYRQLTVCHASSRVSIGEWAFQIKSIFSETNRSPAQSLRQVSIFRFNFGRDSSKKQPTVAHCWLMDIDKFHCGFVF